jgi:uncharacterized protein (DUF305 family)
MLAVAGCSGGGANGSGPQTETAAAFNDTDVMFLQMMVPHHREGIEIVEYARDRATNPELKTLAAAIAVTQADEVKAMAGWLTAWGQPATADAAAHAAHGGMPGTSTQEIARLGEAPPAEFERLFLNMLIAHQDDAVQIARLERAGVNPEAKSLARRIELSRAAQIEQMLAMLGQ